MDSFTVGQIVGLEDLNRVPLGTTVRFTEGFLVRQGGIKGVVHPTGDFWDVTVDERDNKRGIFIPEGTEDPEIPGVFKILRGSRFSPLGDVRVKEESIEIIALPS